MKFGEKVRQLRIEKKLSQTQLGKLCGISLRTIRNYEVAGRYPKKREVYSKLSVALGCNINYLLAENEEAEVSSTHKFDNIEEVISAVTAYFSDSAVSDYEKDSVFKALKASYSVEKKKRKKTQWNKC